MEVIKLDGNASGAVNEINRMLTAMQAYNITVDDLIVKAAKLNTAGTQTNASVQTQVSEYVKLEAELKKVNGVWDVQTTKLNADTAALEKHAKASKAAAAAMAANAQKTQLNAARGTAETELRAYFPIPGNATTDQLVKYETNLQRVLKMVGTGKITFDQFTAAFDKLKSGDKTGLTGFTEDQVKAFSAMDDLSGAFEKTESKSEKLGLSFRHLFNIGEALVFKAALSGITNEITDSIGAAVQFQVALSEIRTISQDSQSTFKEWSESLTRVSDQLGLPIMDVTAAAYETLSNQTTKGAAETERFLKVAGEFARVTTSTTKDSINLLTSAFNSYKIPVEDAERVSAIFFRTIDLGRIKATDLANSFGRVAQPAAQLGVSLEETTAALTVLTRQGVTPSDAMTQLLNVFIKLIKPTDQMKSLLESWGTPTGEAAVATFGFAGVLGKLEEASKGSIGELSALFNEIRGLRGASGLTAGGLFKDFQKDLEQMKDAGKDFDLAKTIRAESAGDTLIKEFNRVKNFFINDFGQNIIDTAQTINKWLMSFDKGFKEIFGVNTGFSSISNSIKSITNFVVDGIKAWLIYKGLMISFAGLTAVTATLKSIAAAFAVSTAATTANTAATAANTAATVANNASKASLLLTLGRSVPVIAGAAAVGYLVYENFIKSKDATQDFSNAVASLDDRLQRLNYKKLEDSVQIDIKDFSKNLAKSFSGVFGGLSNDIRKSADELNVIRDKATEVSSALGNSFKSWTDRIQDGIRNYSQEISRARSAIERSEKSIVNFGDTVDQILHNTQLKYATEFQQIQLTEQQIRKLGDKAGKLFETGNIQDFEEAVKLVNELARLEEDLFNRRTVMNKNQFQRDIQEDIKQFGKNSIWAGKPGEANVANFIVSTDPLKKRLVELQNLLEAQRLKFKQTQEEQMAGNKAIEESEKSRKRRIEELSKALVDFDTKTKDGNVKPEFRLSDGSNKVDQSKVDAFAKKIRDDLMNLKRPEDDMADDPLKVFADIEKKMSILHEQGLAERRDQDLKDRQIRAQQQEKFLGEEAGKALKRPGQIVQELTDAGGSLDKLLNAAKNLASVAQEQGLFYSDRNPQPGLTERPDRFKARRESDVEQRNIRETLLPQTEALINELKQKTIAGTISKDELSVGTEQVRANLDSMAGSLIRMRELFEKQQGKDIDREKAIDETNRRFIPGTKEGATVGANFADAYNTIEEIMNKLKESEAAINKANTLKEAGRTGDFTGFLRATGSAQVAVDSVSMVFSEGLYPATQNLVKGFQTLQNNLNAITVPNIPQQNAGSAFSWFDSFAGYAEGGIVEGPGGIDNVIARLSRGEFVMPVQQTNQFLPQLLAMRHGVQPYGAGSHVSTTVGDINITVQGQPSPDKIVRDLGHKLRREIRRGNITFEK